VGAGDGLGQPGEIGVVRGWLRVHEGPGCG
jgi:hypothetical protein